MIHVITKIGISFASIFIGTSLYKTVIFQLASEIKSKGNLELHVKHRVLKENYSMEYKPLDLNKVCSASFMGLSGVNLYQNISLQHGWLYFHFLSDS